VRQATWEKKPLRPSLAAAVILPDTEKCFSSNHLSGDQNTSLPFVKVKSKKPKKKNDF